MKVPGRRLLFCLPLAMALGMAGCASWSVWPGGGNATVERVAGLLERDGQGWTLYACGQEEGRPLQPTAELERLFDEVGQPGQVSVFAELAVLDRDGRWTINTIQRLESTGRGCLDASAADSQWVGFSLADGWRVDITAQGMRLSTDDTEDGRQLSAISEQLPDGTIGFRGVHDQGLELWLYPTGCVERGTGDYYHLNAVLVRDGQRLKGCGYQGAVQP